MINILCVIISCQKHKHLWQDILNKDINIIIVTGSNAHHFYQINNNILELNCDDNYEGLPEKIIFMIEVILTDKRFENVTHILKIDDHDNFFTQKNVEILINAFQDSTSPIYNQDYIGQRLQTKFTDRHRKAHFSKVSSNSSWKNKIYNGTYVNFFHGGCSYVLSKKAMRFINKTYSYGNIKEIREKEIFEDVMIAKILASNNIFPTRFLYGIKGDKPNRRLII